MNTIADQSDLRSHSRKALYQPGTHRWLGEQTDGADKDTVAYTVSGQPNRVGQREYVWDALGRLTEVRQENQALARYVYSHRGERVGKTAAASGSQGSQGNQGNQNTYYLYNEQRQLSAELDGAGNIKRQYVYLADQPIAVIDSPEGKTLSNQAQSEQSPLVQDAKTIGLSWWRSITGGSVEQLVWLHPNHLGAPQAATDQDGQVVWRASYAPFGAAKVTAVSAGVGADQARPAQAFSLNLRLPGQYFDFETGLHYNHHRYYDPSRGEYLTPDPLGNPDGPNPYAYVRYNPLKYIDPLGLVLFAFDGTENTDDKDWLAARDGSLSNVLAFRKKYLSDGRNSRYITGVGTIDRSDPERPILAPDGPLGHTLNPDKGFNYSGPARIARMVEYFGNEADAIKDDNTAMDVDIIGFSRGAAQARDFSNRIVAASKKDKEGNYWYGYKDTDQKDQCQKVSFRFIGLWDTVLSQNSSGHAYQLGIPEQFTYVAQAVALNEHRGVLNAWGRPDPSNLDTIGAFPLESIMGGAVPAGQTRIERGFVGAHADIGGGFKEGENTLSKVALAWMVEQARTAGVTMSTDAITIDASPVIHDKSNNIQVGAPAGPPGSFGVNEDRQVRYLGGATTTQRVMTDTGLTYAEIVNQGFINYTPRAELPTNLRDEIMSNKTGTVNMSSYIAWLKLNGYELGSLKIQ